MTTQTAFDHFQTATCLIGEDRRSEAAAEIELAIAAIDATGVDAHLRRDLVDLHRQLQQ